MKPKKEKRNITLAVSITAEEKAALREDFRNTNQRVFSDYIRALLKSKPVIRKYRNQSLEDLHLTMIGIKAELEEVCRNFGRAVERVKALHAEMAAGEVEEAMGLLVEEELALKKEVTVIKSTLIKLYEKCLQESNLWQR